MIAATALRQRQTILQPAQISGKGIHGGQVSTLRFLPAPSGTGRRFRRTDLPGNPEIPALLDYVAKEELERRTTLRNGDARVYTVEHTLAAAYALQIDDLIIELDAPEPPFLDGSALPFVKLLRDAGVSVSEDQIQPGTLPRSCVFSHDQSEFVVLPAPEFRVTFFYVSPHPRLRSQTASFTITPEIFASEIAPARTFCFFDEIESMRRARLIQGANLNSAVVIGRKGILNDSLRFPDEPVRHKILDLVGDLALLGQPVTGHYMAYRAGHCANAFFGLHLRKELN